jgi:4-hydroxy-tetrahydrodipicolinate synthase
MKVMCFMSLVPKGIIPPIVTPFNHDGSVNYDMLRKVTGHLVESGVHGIFPLGTSGEFYAVSDDDYKKILLAVKEEINGRVPLYAGANHITAKGVIHLIRICEEVGVDAVSVLTPMFVSQTQDELYCYYRSIAESTKLPIILYNNMPKTNVTIKPETVARLAGIDNIIAIKDSTGDMTNTLEYIRLTRDYDNFHVLVGRDTLIYSGLCSGASGAVASCANVAPEIAVSIYEKFIAKDYKGALEAQYQFAPIRLACSMGSFPAVIKESLRLEGFDVGKCADPIGELTPEQKIKLKNILRDAELIRQ